METPGLYGPSSVPLPARTPPLPFLAKLVVCFLGADAIERCVELIRWALSHAPASDLTGSEFDMGGPLGLLAIGISALLELILILLILLRTWWGRIWTQTVFAIHLFYTASLVLVHKPEIWVYLGEPGRLRLGATLVLDSLALAYLFSAEARRALDR